MLALFVVRFQPTKLVKPACIKPFLHAPYALGLVRILPLNPVMDNVVGLVRVNNSVSASVSHRQRVHQTAKRYSTLILLLRTAPPIFSLHPSINGAPFLRSVAASSIYCCHPPKIDSHASPPIFSFY
jgi:hypothetical protein